MDGLGSHHTSAEYCIWSYSELVREADDDMGKMSDIAKRYAYIATLIRLNGNNEGAIFDCRWCIIETYGNSSKDMLCDDRNFC